MEAKSIEQLWGEAKAHHAGMDANDRPSVEAIFLTLSLNHHKTPHGYKHKEAPVTPDWFADGVKKLAGKKLSASEVFALVCPPKSRGAALQKGVQAKNQEAKQTGSWLRGMGYTPRKSGGRLVFDL